VRPPAAPRLTGAVIGRRTARPVRRRAQFRRRLQAVLLRTETPTASLTPFLELTARGSRRHVVTAAYCYWVGIEPLAAAGRVLFGCPIACSRILRYEQISRRWPAACGPTPARHVVTSMRCARASDTVRCFRYARHATAYLPDKQWIFHHEDYMKPPRVQVPARARELP